MDYLSLFSGIGGFEYGIEQSEYSQELNCIGFSEIDKYAKSIYRKQFPNHKDLGDAKEINTEELPNFDLLIGGFPCQAFSHAGKRRGFDDTRGTLFFEISRILKDKRPTHFLLENVPGLLSHNGGQTFKKMLGILTDLGYRTQWQVLNSKDFGVPQNRKRVYLIGHLRRRGRREVFLESGTKPKVNGGLIQHDIVQQVTKRKHKVNIEKLKDCLKSAKQSLGYTNPQISERLGVTKTTVEHWFRNDDCFSIPDPTIWLQLKKLLKINTDEFDEPIMEFEVVDGVYEKANRAYDEQGLAPTITSTSGELIQVNNSSQQAQRIFSPQGLSSSLCANGGGQGGKTGLYDVGEREIKKLGNINPNGTSQSGNVYDPHGVGPAMCSSDWKCPTKVKIDEKREPEKVGNVFPSDYSSGAIYNPKNIAPTLICSHSQSVNIKLQSANKRGYEEGTVGDGVNLARIGSKTGRGRVQDQKANTLTIAGTMGTITPEYRIRRLTPIECERIQGFPDNWTQYNIDGEIVSNTQRYKCLGNAVTTKVVTYLINNLYPIMNSTLDSETDSQLDSEMDS